MPSVLPAFISVVTLCGCENTTRENTEHNLWVQKEGKVSPVQLTARTERSSRLIYTLAAQLASLAPGKVNEV